MLHSYKDIFVSYEADFVDGIVKGKKFSIEKNCLEKRNLKFSSWNLSTSFLKDLGRDNTLNYNQFLHQVLTYNSTTERVLIYKNGKYKQYIPKLQNLFPLARVIFITRDPRSLYLSQTRSTSSITGEAMTPSDSVLFSKQYQMIENLVNKHRDTVLKVKYEDIVQDPKSTIKTILNFLDASVDISSKNYAEGIHRTQKHLHTNIKDSPNVKHQHKWKSSLSEKDNQTIKYFAHKAMKANGYINDVERLSAPSVTRLLQYYIKGNFLKYIWTWIKIRFQINKSHLLLR